MGPSAAGVEAQDTQAKLRGVSAGQGIILSVQLSLVNFLLRLKLQNAVILAAKQLHGPGLPVIKSDQGCRCTKMRLPSVTTMACTSLVGQFHAIWALQQPEAIRAQG